MNEKKEVKKGTLGICLIYLILKIEN